MGSKSVMALEIKPFKKVGCHVKIYIKKAASIALTVGFTLDYREALMSGFVRGTERDPPLLPSACALLPSSKLIFLYKKPRCCVQDAADAQERHSLGPSVHGLAGAAHPRHAALPHPARQPDLSSHLLFLNLSSPLLLLINIKNIYFTSLFLFIIVDLNPLHVHCDRV